ncbi:MAG: hypothetical protein II993_04525 [Anaerotignum sp.]|nr:hypothetical protein [Anaerotignum sp.]
MKKYTLLLFYCVPWITIGAKAALYLDRSHQEWVGIVVILAAVLYMGILCVLAFYWGRRKKSSLWLGGSVIQYLVNLWFAKPALGNIGAAVDDIYLLLQFLSGFLQIGMYFVGRREGMMHEKS